MGKGRINRGEEVQGLPDFDDIVRQFARSIEIHLKNRNEVFAVRSVRQFFEAIEEVSAKPPRMDCRDIPDEEAVASLAIDLRHLNALDAAGIIYVGQLRTKTLLELMKIKGITPMVARTMLTLVGLGRAADSQFFEYQLQLSQLPIGSR